MDNGFNNQGFNGNQMYGQNNMGNGMNNGNMGNMNGNINNPNLYAPNNNMGGGYNVGNLPGFTATLICSILELVCCCNLICGILGIVFCVMANSAWKTGDANDAYKKLKVAKIVLIVGIVLAIIGGVVGCATGVINASFSTTY